VSCVLHLQTLEHDRGLLKGRLAASCDKCRAMRAHLDEFAELLRTMTRAAHTEQSDVVYDVALKLEQTQHVLSELFHELSQAATDRHSAEHRGICFIIGSTKRLLRSTELRFRVLSSHHCVACP